MNKLSYIKLPKDEASELTDKLYHFNSKIISLKWIGLKIKPNEADILSLNKLLGETIKFLRGEE